MYFKTMFSKTIGEKRCMQARQYMHQKGQWTYIPTEGDAPTKKGDEHTDSLNYILVIIRYYYIIKFLPFE